MIDAVISFALNSPIFVGFSFLYPYLHFSSRDTIERVADIMQIYGFIHVAEAFAVRTLLHK